MDTWAVACDINDNEIDFINAATDVTDLNFTDGTNITGNQARSVAVGTIAGNTYMVVGSQSANTLLVYQLTSTSAIGEWTMYN